MSSTINKYDCDDIKKFYLVCWFGLSFRVRFLSSLFGFSFSGWLASLVVAASINRKHHYSVAVVASPRSCGSVIRVCCGVIIRVMRYVNIV